MSAPTDRELECCDCGSAFVWTVAEQEFFAEQGYANQPRRCVECRRQRRQARTTFTHAGAER